MADDILKTGTLFKVIKWSNFVADSTKLKMFPFFIVLVVPHGSAFMNTPTFKKEYLLKLFKYSFDKYLFNEQ